MSHTKRFGHPSNIVNCKPYDKLATPNKGSAKHPKLGKEISQLYANSNVHRDIEEASVPALDITDLRLPPFQSTPASLAVSRYEVGTNNDQPGFPTYAEWTIILNDYLTGLHKRKREKALISQEMHELIYDVLTSPDDTRQGTPQFRFWARKMFTLVDIAGATAVTHDGRPVAVKEHIYDVLCMCHAEAGHAGRDKTCQVIREYYTWIPKELTANFVKACPTCAVRRSGNSVLISAALDAVLREPPKDSVAAFPAQSLAGSMISGGPNDQQYGDMSVDMPEPISTSSDVKAEQTSQCYVPLVDNNLAACADTSSHIPFSARQPPLESTGDSGAECLAISIFKHTPLLPSIKQLFEANSSGNFGDSYTLPGINPALLKPSAKPLGVLGVPSVTLPPLMKHLSESVDLKNLNSNGSPRGINPAMLMSSSDIPIDPVLLFDGGRHTRDRSATGVRNHVSIQVQQATPSKPAGIRRDRPAPLDLSSMHIINQAWDSHTAGQLSASSSLSTPTSAASFVSSSSADLSPEESAFRLRPWDDRETPSAALPPYTDFFDLGAEIDRSNTAPINSMNSSLHEGTVLEQGELNAGMTDVTSDTLHNSMELEPGELID